MVGSTTLTVPPGHSSPGQLERVLRGGRFAVTAELDPPDSADPNEVYERALVLSEVCDATDASGANVHMSSIAMCSFLGHAGYAPVRQISCRDRNRIATQGDVLGAAAMGVTNVLCLTGDGVGVGDQPEAKPVFDLGSISLLATIRAMRDEGRFLSGRPITVPPLDFRPLRLAEKIEAGAQFIQTQYCFDLPVMERYMDRVRALGLDERCFILAGVGALVSARAARWMRARMPGVHIPDAIVARLEGAKDEKREGRDICIEIIQRLRDIPGIAGVHVMAYRQAELVSEIIAASGILEERRRRAPSSKTRENETQS